MCRNTKLLCGKYPGGSLGIFESARLSCIPPPPSRKWKKEVADPGNRTQVFKSTVTTDTDWANSHLVRWERFELDFLVFFYEIVLWKWQECSQVDRLFQPISVLLKSLKKKLPLPRLEHRIPTPELELIPTHPRVTLPLIKHLNETFPSYSWSRDFLNVMIYLFEE